MQFWKIKPIRSADPGGGFLKPHQVTYDWKKQPHLDKMMHLLMKEKMVVMLLILMTVAIKRMRHNFPWRFKFGCSTSRSTQQQSTEFHCWRHSMEEKATWSECQVQWSNPWNREEKTKIFGRCLQKPRTWVSIVIFPKPSASCQQNSCKYEIRFQNLDTSCQWVFLPTTFFNISAKSYSTAVTFSIKPKLLHIHPIKCWFYSIRLYWNFSNYGACGCTSELFYRRWNF